MKMHSYWLDTATPSGDYSQTELPREVDVAVVGGGFTGLSAAYHAAKQGLSVAVLEAHTVNWGASGRNGGMATTGLAIGFGSAVKRYGERRAVAYFEEYNKAIDLVENLVSEHDLDVDYARTGKMNLAVKPQHFAGMQRSAEQLNRLVGQSVSLVDRANIRSEVGSDAYHGAMIDPKGAGMHVGKFGHELARLAIEAGATIHEQAEVVDFERIGSGAMHILKTSRGNVKAGAVILGTSGYTGKPFGWNQRRIIPVGSFITVTEPLAQDVVDELLPNRRMTSTMVNFTHYFRITPDNRLLFGGRARFALSDPSQDRESGEILLKARDEIFPQLRDARTDYMWGGLVDISMDQMPHAGQHEGMFYSHSYCGHGVQMANYMGKVMVDVVKGNPEANLWRDLRHPWIPGYYGNPWAHLRAGGAFFALQDRLS